MTLLRIKNDRFRSLLFITLYKQTHKKFIPPRNCFYFPLPTAVPSYMQAAPPAEKKKRRKESQRPPVTPQQPPHFRRDPLSKRILAHTPRVLVSAGPSLFTYTQPFPKMLYVRRPACICIFLRCGMSCCWGPRGLYLRDKNVSCVGFLARVLKLVRCTCVSLRDIRSCDVRM